MSRSRGLLAYLEPALRPAGSGERVKSVRAGGNGGNGGGGEVETADVGRLSFDHLITLAQQGQLATGRKVTVAPGIRISIGDLARIGAAADRVEAKGGKRAVVFSRKEMLLLDIAKRRITEKLVGTSKSDNEKSVSIHDQDEQIVSGIDTAVILRDADEGEEAVNEEEAGRILAGLERPLRVVGS